MRNSEKVLTELSKQAQNKDYEFHRIYRIICNPYMFIKAYCNIYNNKGSSTSGIDNRTADNFNEDLIDEIINSLKDESYQVKPVKRIYIPKKNGKTRPLGIPNFQDRLVQEVCRMVLESIYEPIFSENSHGFRPNRSCHTALKQIKNTFRGANWFIEGDIKGCFDNIDHRCLINILQKRIKDERFIRLIWKFLKAGYMENWKYNNTHSGTPQGGILSPILANIYLSELDNYIDKIKSNITKDNKGDVQRCKNLNPEYRSVDHKMQVLRKHIKQLELDDKDRKELIEEYKRLEKYRYTLPAQLGLKNYKNIQYIRYADDFIIAVLGSKEDCQNIKSEIAKFLNANLKLELSEEKTLITHSHDKARFLNYELQVRNNSKIFVDKNGVKRRVGNLGVVLYMPHDVVINYITSKKVIDDINASHWSGKARPFMQVLSDLEIITSYNAEIKGLYNYYAMAENVSDQMGMLYHVMEYSCLKTLAGKHKCSVAKIKANYRIGKGWGVRYDTAKEKNKIRYFYNQGFQMSNRKLDYNFDELVNTNQYVGRTELEQRMKASKCELCGKENVKFHIHHTNKVKNLKGKTPWEQIMIAKNRKTLVVCEECHRKIHST